MRTIAILLWSLILPAASFAQSDASKAQRKEEPPQLRNDPRRPVEAISRDLQIQPQQFVACFDNVRPAKHGEHPTSERVHANKQVLLSCLQKANPAITNEKLDEVMDRYRPGGKEGQRPVN